MTDPDVLVVPDGAAWRAWLDANEDSSDGVWLLLARKGVTDPTSLSYAQALDEALCSGWIDGQAKRVDERTYRQRFTPRRQRSLWSARNVQNVARLTAERRMRPRGVAEVERAKADGRWERAYQGPAGIEMPPDLARALDDSPAAAAKFATLNGQNRYAVLHRVTTAATDATRQRRIANLVGMLARGETPYPQ
ncbi:YdeI/OmpD-associated family protein [Polymorphospora sp. NPDC051019]|uniref:YdeI/OmpD-associated family protein n=1 Tax=Polymorphospora sp. NPDC051019 TaxID=3155725 RepID=UPI003440F617